MSFFLISLGTIAHVAATFVLNRKGLGEAFRLIQEVISTKPSTLAWAYWQIPGIDPKKLEAKDRGITKMNIVPWKLRYLFRCLFNAREVKSVFRFLFRRDLPVPFLTRAAYIAQIYRISLYVWCAHTQEEILEVATAVLKMPKEIEGTVIEAGCYKGGSTAKFSLVAKLADRRLVAFDSFEGLPSNDESNQQSIFGELPNFGQGVYLGTLEEVRQNVRRYGDLDRCTFIKGWFDNTMPNFSEKIVGGYIDVDLASSTKTCLKFLFPHLQPGGSLFTQDGHLPLVIKVLDDDLFWQKEVGRTKPPMEGLHKEKLVRMINLPS